MLLAVGFGLICRPSSSPICPPICSWLLAGPISAPRRPLETRFSLSRTDQTPAGTRSRCPPWLYQPDDTSCSGGPMRPHSIPLISPPSALGGILEVPAARRQLLPGVSTTPSVHRHSTSTGNPRKRPPRGSRIRSPGIKR